MNVFKVTKIKDAIARGVPIGLLLLTAERPSRNWTLDKKALGRKPELLWGENEKLGKTTQSP
jgi:hypothetical protein